MARTRAYSAGALVAEDFPVAEISDWIAKDGCAVWADFVSPTEQDLAAIQEELGLHRLAVEDAVTEHQRPKLDRYDTHQFLAVYDTTWHEDSGAVTKSPVMAFITRKALVTVHEPAFDVQRLVDRWDGLTEIAAEGVRYLLWGLLDVVVDRQFDTVQQLDAAADDLEDALFDDRPRDAHIQQRSFALRKSVVQVRRAVLPMRDILSALVRHSAEDRSTDEGDRVILPYLQDVFNHVLQSIEWSDTVRDLIATIVDTDIGLRANRMNLIMKKVTSWAAIIAVPTAITGFFGQNVLFPGFGSWWGLVISSTLVLVVGFGLYFSFRRRDWL